MKTLMNKLGAVILGAGLLAGAAAACDLDIETRSKMVAPFVEAVKPCLTNLPDGYRWDYAAERLHLKRINEERAKAGLSPVKLRYETLDAARFMSLDMGINEFFDHVGPDGRGVTDRISAFDRRGIVNWAAENIALTTTNIDDWELDEAPEKLHVALMKSPGHRRNILHKKATHVSIGILRSKRGVWITQVFTGVTGTLSDDLPLRIGAGEPIPVRPYVNDWDFNTFGGETPQGQEYAFKKKQGTIRVSEDVTGDLNLLILSEQKEDPIHQDDGTIIEATRTISFIGPAFTVAGKPS